MAHVNVDTFVGPEAHVIIPSVIFLLFILAILLRYL
jgi:hypothetical protein